MVSMSGQMKELDHVNPLLHTGKQQPTHTKEHWLTEKTESVNVRTKTNLIQTFFEIAIKNLFSRFRENRAKKKVSFLGGRLAGKEAAYFFQESKPAVNRIAEKSLPTTAKKLPPSPSDIQPDVLPEVLRHSLPPRLYGPRLDILNPLRGCVSLPQVTFGSRRFQLYPN
ncbi:unnamed protein product [Eruca vesicaria subsp. sativa]|uniref:Uncharacterized protein n=1 Tax=Eruca vesicaria subsp. sativa TaxID=29727 RepID=A0ABC8LR87_ERUVS|nr:unnamed protein product [Eruca vesicaria subsp. sativa]